jgi:flagellar basal-body rod protein FlgB
MPDSLACCSRICRCPGGLTHGTGIALVVLTTSLAEVIVVSKLEGALFLQQQAMNLRANRQQVLAGNIANADTPNYKARDFDFTAALRNAVGDRRQGGLALAGTAAGHLQGSVEAAPPRLIYRQATQPSADGNTVDMDVERAQFAENAVHYEAGVTFLTAQIRTLLAAMQG